MSLLISVFIWSLCFAGVVASLWFWKERRYLALTISLNLVIKLIVLEILETGLKYVFVLDSLKYELDSWNLIKSSISGVAYITDDFERKEYLNPFTQIGMQVFNLFGKFPEMITLINILAHLGMTIFCILSLQLILESSHSKFVKRSLTFFSICILFYPSLTIWSTTNTKDPISLFFMWLGLWACFHLQVRHGFKILWMSLAIFSFYFSGLFRPYFNQVLMAGLGFGVMLYFALRFFRLRTILIFGLFAFVIGGYAWEYIYPTGFADVSKQIYNARRGFINEDWVDDFAESAFLVNFNFQHFTDYLLFLPLSLAYYFLSPFVWEIHSVPEALGLLEVLMLVALFPLFWRGLKSLYQFQRLFTCALAGVFVVLTLSQSFIIGNIGTIFRHRSLVVLIYFLFSAAGYLERLKRKEAYAEVS